MGNITNRNSVIICNNRVWINGIELPPVPRKRKTNTHSQTSIGDHVYVDGYEWKNGEWRRTLKAMWYK